MTAYGPGLTHGIVNGPAYFTIVNKDAGAGTFIHKIFHHVHDVDGLFTKLIPTVLVQAGDFLSCAGYIFPQYFANNV